jgi:hypothetical protein
LAPLGGGMENQTMTTLTNFNFNLVSHELSHQWFGDNVTCDNWQDIWLNEGFASYCELIAIENLKPKEIFTEWIKETHTVAMSQPNGSIYLTEEQALDENRIFNLAMTYKKGASILHMIRHELNNDELFFNILKSYQDKYSDSVAKTEDFKQLLEQHSQLNFDKFFTQWYYGEGYPILKINWQQKNDSLYINILQTTSAPAKTIFFDLLLDLKLEYYGGDTLIRLQQNKSTEFYEMPFSRILYKITADPDQWLLMKIDTVQRILPDKIIGNFNIFPNPAQDEVYIENYGLNKAFVIKVYDEKGIIRIEINSNDPIVRININDLESGIYQVIITSEDEKEIFHLAKT